MTHNSIPQKDKYLVKIFLVACKKSITRKWFEIDSPTQQDWEKIVKELYVMELLSHKIRTEEQLFQKRWEKWLIYSVTRK